MYQRFSEAVADILLPAAKQGQFLYTPSPHHTDMNTVAKRIEVLIQRYKKTYRLRPDQVNKLKDIVMQQYDNCMALVKK